MLSAQGITEKEVENTISKLNEDFEKQIEKLNTAINNIRSESESRMKKCCDFDVMDHVCKNVPTKEILEAI
jgi:glutamine synthetase type III